MTQPDTHGAPTPPRRSVIAGGAGAALGISTLALPSATVAASPGSSTPTQGTWVDTGYFSAGTTGTVYGVTFDGTRFIVGGSDGKYHYSDGTDTSSWTTVQTSMDDDGYHLASDGSTLVVANEFSGEVYRVANAFGGSTSVTGVREFSTDAYFVTYVTGGPDDRSVWVVGLDNKDAYYSEDGETWTAISQHPFNGASYLHGLAYDASQTVTSKYYALGFNTDTFRQTDDLSTAWSNMGATGLPADPRHLAYDGSSTLVVVDALNVAANSVPYRSTDGGATWSAATTAISGRYECVIHTGSSFVALGAPGGNTSGTTANVIESTDGDTWTDMSTGDVDNDTFASRSSAAFGGGRIVASTGDKVLVYVV